MKAHCSCVAFCLGMATICTGMAYASGPIAVYALVDKVAFEPGSGKPERIRISGVFITAERTPDNSIAYSAPQRGYFYFELPKSHEELALREWADLKSVAGTRQVVGFGSAWYSQLHVKKPDEEAKAPVAYPLGNGMIKVNPDQPRASALLNYKGR